MIIPSGCYSTSLFTSRELLARDTARLRSCPAYLRPIAAVTIRSRTSQFSDEVFKDALHRWLGALPEIGCLGAKFLHAFHQLHER